MYNLIRQLRASDCRARYDESKREVAKEGRKEGRRTPENGGLMAS